MDIIRRICRSADPIFFDARFQRFLYPIFPNAGGVSILSHKMLEVREIKTVVAAYFQQIVSLTKRDDFQSFFSFGDFVKRRFHFKTLLIA